MSCCHGLIDCHICNLREGLIILESGAEPGAKASLRLHSGKTHAAALSKW